MGLDSSFVNIMERDFYFEGCDECDSRCCDGRQGFSLAPLVLEDFELVYRRFPILFAWLGGELKAVMMMNDGQSACPYCIERRCTIYEARPPACRIYPLSPYYDELLIDTECPAVNSRKLGQKIMQEGKPVPFYHERLENFSSKLEKTKQFLDGINKPEDFQPVGTIGSLKLYRYIGPDESDLIRMHRDSLRHMLSDH